MFFLEEVLKKNSLDGLENYFVESELGIFVIAENKKNAFEVFSNIRREEDIINCLISAGAMVYDIDSSKIIEDFKKPTFKVGRVYIK